MSKRILGNIVDIKPMYVDCNLLYICVDHYQSNIEFMHSPAFWFEYNEELHYAICDYNMDVLETFDDWEMDTNKPNKLFCDYLPEQEEFDHLMKLKPVIYKVEFDRLDDFIDEFCEIELEFCKVYKRRVKIDNILKS